jgi:drug/metabolite transporter (DMT)-like permease
LFSTKAIWIKLCFKETAIDAATLLMLRMLIAFPFYVVVFILTRKKWKGTITNNHYYWAIGMGLLGYYMSSLFDFIGLQYVSAGIERIILFVYPTLAVIINWLLFKVPITKRQWQAIVITYMGIGIAYWGEIHLMPNTPLFLYGSFMVLLCGITYAFYLVGTGKLVPTMGTSIYTSIAMIAASMGIFIHYVITKTVTGDLENLLYTIPPNILWYVIALAMLATVIPSFLLSAGMKRLGSNNLAIITSIGPVATLFQANWILGESFTWQQFLGTALVIAGVLLINKRKDV